MSFSFGLDKLSDYLFILASLLFVLAILSFRHQETAKRGIYLGVLGMALALAAVLMLPEVENYWLVAIAAGVPCVLSAVAAQYVKMTSLPQMVGLLNAFGGWFSVCSLSKYVFIYQVLLLLLLLLPSSSESQTQETHFWSLYSFVLR